MNITILLIIIILALLIVVLMSLVHKVNQQDATIVKLTSTISTYAELMSTLAHSNKQLANCLKDTMIEVEGHSKMIETIAKQSQSTD